MNTANFAAFVLSTGRCGTQWIAATLSDAYPDHIEVTHEPLHDRYEARKALAHGDFADSPTALPPEVAAHADEIERRLESGSYVECGHPNWSTIPYYARRFHGRVRIIHLTRHPVPTCFSWLTHFAYQPPLLPHLREKVLLSPFDEGVAFPEYQKTWINLSPFEKCLYYWSEVSAFALDLQSRMDVPWLRLGYQDLFEGDGLEELLSFLNLPPTAESFRRRSEVVDNHRYASPVQADWRLIQNHPRTMAVARQLGYELMGIDEAALNGRYGAGPPRF